MFDDYFEVFLADTAKSKEIHYSIRYQVYCEEMGFENKDKFPKKLENDDYDNHSVHFIVRHKHTGAWVGAMRLIFKNNQALPVEKLCNLDEPIGYNRSFRSVELSRLCLVREIRKRITDLNSPHGITDENKIISTDNVKPLYNHYRNGRSIVWGLLRAATEYGYHNDIQKCYFLMTKALAKIIRKGGLTLQDIGPSCYHNGERYPFRMNVAETYRNRIWHDYRNGYRLFSELDVPATLKAA